MAVCCLKGVLGDPSVFTYACRATCHIVLVCNLDRFQVEVRNTITVLTRY